MKRINSIDGCNDRDHELGFAIGPDTVSAYFGRAVNAERRRQYTDDESRMEDRTNLDTMDYVFCTECEKLFSKYESKYSKTYDLHFDSDLTENTKVTGAEAALFWFGVFWRLSATNHYGKSLDPLFEDKLRQIVLSENVNGYDIYYSIQYCKNYRNIFPTYALFDCSGDVALLIVDEFIVTLFNGKDAPQSNEELWMMSFKCNVSKLNSGASAERIALMPIPIFKLINDNNICQLVHHMDFRGKFNNLHSFLFGNEMPDYIFNEVMDEVHKAKLADRYTNQNFAKAMKVVILAHPEIYDII